IEEGLSYKDIAVLYRRQSQGEVIAYIFEKEGIPYKKPFKKPLIFEDSISTEEDDNKVNLLTLHASKGLEFSHIFIIGANMGNMPISTKRDEEEEEARLFFVGLTRAKNYIEISYHVKPSLQGVSPYMSPYITMIPQNLITKEDESNSLNLSTLMNMLREEREKKRKEEKVTRAKHPKYGEGIVVFEDENIIRVNFNAYGEKEFSKLFCPIEIY
ncbi:3'-5' exonuclease, partial [Fervidicella metallireducens]|uniref:3'-5' exonuclease n=1 Tax=Fervidicella metallireducens TaxID=655338 RepID=UPI000551F5D7